MKKFIAFLLFAAPLFSMATNRTVSGAGFSVTSMGVLTNGDTLFIDASSSTNFGYCVLKGIHDVTVMNINGPIKSGTQWDWGNLVRVAFNFSTNGAIQLAGDPTNKYYGLIFQNGTNNNYGMIQVVDTIQFCTFMNIAVINCATGLGSPQQSNITYDNANKVHKKLLGNTFTNLFQRNTPGAIFPSGGTVYNNNVADSNTYSYSVYDSLTTQNVMAGGYHAFIHHNQFIVVGTMVDSLDHGLLEPLLGFNIHDNLLIGNYRGWFTRLGPGNGHGLEAFGSGKNDSYWWNNIRIGSYDPYQRYGGLDIRIDTPNATYTHGGNVWVYNNTLGNMRESPVGNWFTSVCLSYGMQGPASAGYVYTIYYYNNFRFRSENQTSGTTAHSVGFVLSGGNGAAKHDSCASCNAYAEDPIAANYLKDTSYAGRCAITATSPLRHTGSVTPLSYPGGTGDYFGNTRPESGQTNPSIGAQEYASGGGSTVTASAGSPQTITRPTNSLTVSAGASFSTGSTITTYAWTQTSGPSSTITSPSSASSTVTGMNTAGNYVYHVVVTDALGATGSDNVTETVNSLVTANAGTNQTITRPTSSLSLDATASTSSAATIFSYSWSKLSGPACTINSPSTATPTVTAMTTAGTYVFQVTVTDSWGSSNTASVTETVNSLVTADAGSPQTITLPTSSLTATAAASSSAGSTISTYQWTKVSGPSCVITSPNSVSTTITGMTTAGTYVFNVLVTDATGSIDNATVTETVNSAFTAPTASAGGTQTITLPTNFLTLNATASTAVGTTITGYAWVKTSGPACTIVTPSGATTSVTGMTAGTYVFTVTVTDGHSLTNTATVTDFVNPAPAPGSCPQCHVRIKGSRTIYMSKP